MDPEERLDSIESKLDEHSKYNAEIRDTLNTLLKGLENLKAGIPANAIPVELTPPPPPTPRNVTSPTGSDADPPRSSRDQRIKPSPPNDFDGDRSKGRAFLSQCELYLSLRRSDFPNDEVRITWALTFMKSGRAANFAERALAYKTKYDEGKYDSWSDFVLAFEDAFCPLNESTNAITRLESESYYQGKRSVDEYIDEIEELIEKSGYKDPLVEVIKFRRGLNPSIQDMIATSHDGRPLDDDFRGWRQAARTLDQNKMANDAFRGRASRSTTSSSTFSTAPAKPNPPRPSFNFVAPVKPSPFIPAPRPPPPVVPMDVDASRSRPMPVVCHRCGTPGHISRNCPLAFDVRHMTTEEQGEWVEHLLASRDVATEVEEAKEEKGESDFTASDE
jgi:hypothetical protein